MGLLIPLIIIALCCLVIWRAGDGFMVASEYVGRHLSEGVRGATINAIASSMPEVFTSFFFLFVLNDASGFSGGIGTTAGSAIFNSMVIPAVSIIAVLSMGAMKRIEISRKVLFRDGIALIIAEFIFLILISGSALDWHHGLLLMSVYVVYIVFMFATMDKKTKEALMSSASQEDEEDNQEEVENTESPSFFLALITLNLEHVFIGKSMIKKLKHVSGQDPIEAAKLNCKIYHGPFVSNFEEIYELLNKLKISKTIHNEIELSDCLIKDLNNFNKSYDNKISVFDSLGKKILEDTYNELNLFIKNENS